jgi:hypothetical protein
VFFGSRLSIGIVNLKPLLPGRQSILRVHEEADQKMFSFFRVELYHVSPTCIATKSPTSFYQSKKSAKY